MTGTEGISYRCENCIATTEGISYRYENWMTATRGISYRCENWMKATKGIRCRCENWTTATVGISYKHENWTTVTVTVLCFSEHFKKNNIKKKKNHTVLMFHLDICCSYSGLYLVGTAQLHIHCRMLHLHSILLVNNNHTR